MTKYNLCISLLIIIILIIYKFIKNSHIIFIKNIFILYLKYISKNFYMVYYIYSV